VRLVDVQTGSSGTGGTAKRAGTESHVYHLRKENAMRIIVEVRGGVVQSVYADSTDVDIDVLDWDDSDASEAGDVVKTRCESLHRECDQLVEVW
jgi:hypothetical protein